MKNVIGRKRNRWTITMARSLFIASLWLGTGHAEADERLRTPVMSRAKPAAGRRVWQQAPEYDGTDVYHVVYLPTNWKKDRTYPVIVEYTGNRYPAAASSGEIKDANLGYGLSGGKGFIWVCMPYVEKGRKKNAPTWWGDREATISYCKANLPRICQRFGGDADNLFICGFSRGAIAVNFIGLADDEIAALWKGFITHDHYDGERMWPYAGSDRAAAIKRLARLRGRPQLVCSHKMTERTKEYLKDHLHTGDFTFLDVPVTKLFEVPVEIAHSHTDLWMCIDSPQRRQAREWLAEQLNEKSKPNE
ncbi:MAG: hypothetical protein VB878_15120 [Pirellulaceae bacterium]